jgi:hypothetical protein
MLTTMLIGSGGFQIWSKESRLSLESRIAQKYLYYYRFSKWTLLIPMTGSESSWHYRITGG